MELLRKVSLAKWKQSLEVGPDHISADAVTACLRTSNNTLSVWKTESGEEERKALLALAASLTSLETIDIVKLSAEELLDRGLVLEATPGDTVARDYIHLHRDIVNLDHGALKVIAELVKEKVRDGHFTRLRKQELRTMLQAALKSGEVKIDDFPEKIRVEVLKN